MGVNELKVTELVIIGGFLGSGKTTSISHIAKLLLNRGKKVGIVTNDQGSDLVDTEYLKKSGLSVLEVTGGCFCCNFDEFTSRLDEFNESDLPDVILAEPVGSCTDLIATIFRPLKLKYTDKMILRPLSVIADPLRLKRLMIEKDSDFHSEINYLFRKQLEEADIIAINKIDLLDDDETTKMMNFIKDNFNDAYVMAVSSKENLNIDKWVNVIFDKVSTERSLNIDYDKYANAEARLGWLNFSANIKGKDKFDLNKLLYDIINEIKYIFIKERYEIAHLKIYGVSSDDWVKASITDKYSEISFDKKSSSDITNFNMLINLRADVEPDKILDVINKVLYDNIKLKGLNIEMTNSECFKPKRPEPKYRIKK